MKRMMMGLLALLPAAPVSATVYTYSFQGSTSYTMTKNGTATLNESGSLSFELQDGNGSPTLGNGLLAFNLTKLATTTSFAYGTNSSSEILGLANVSNFSATVSSGKITALNFSSGDVFATSPSYIVVTTGYSPSIFANLMSSVPEPGSWGMMLAGLGTIGVAIRRRRAASAFSMA